MTTTHIIFREHLRWLCKKGTKAVYGKCSPCGDVRRNLTIKINTNQIAQCSVSQSFCRGVQSVSLLRVTTTPGTYYFLYSTSLN